MAGKDEIIGKLRALLPADAVKAEEGYLKGIAYTVSTDLGKVRETAAAFKESGFYLESMTALDFEDAAELVYHFNCYEPKSRIVVRAMVREEDEPETVSDLLAAAEWYEREIREFFGIRFANHPDPRNLLLPEDADYHPLKKTYGIVHARGKREEIYG